MPSARLTIFLGLVAAAAGLTRLHAGKPSWGPLPFAASNPKASPPPADVKEVGRMEEDGLEQEDLEPAMEQADLEPAMEQEDLEAAMEQGDLEIAGEEADTEEDPEADMQQGDSDTGAEPEDAGQEEPMTAANEPLAEDLVTDLQEAASSTANVSEAAAVATETTVTAEVNASVVANASQVDQTPPVPEYTEMERSIFRDRQSVTPEILPNVTDEVWYQDFFAAPTNALMNLSFTTDRTGPTPKQLERELAKEAAADAKLGAKLAAQAREAEHYYDVVYPYRKDNDLDYFSEHRVNRSANMSATLPNSSA